MVKWALLNILLAFATGIIAILSASRHKDVNLTPYEKRKVYLAKSIAIYIGIVSCLVCLFSEQPVGALMLVADKWSIILLFLLIGELLTDYFVGKKCHPKDWEKTSE
jgi:cell division protein FtsW (lipid II flippase)